MALQKLTRPERCAQTKQRNNVRRQKNIEKMNELEENSKKVATGLRSQVRKGEMSAKEALGLLRVNFEWLKSDLTRWYQQRSK